MSAERALRIKHARALLDGVDGHHCGGHPAELLARARQSVLGRRHLVRAGLSHAPALFAPDQERWEQLQQAHPWLLWPHDALMAFTEELGVLSLAPSLRIVLERNHVLFLREALGAEHWRLVQTVELWGGPSSETLRMMGNVVLQRCGRDPMALRAAVFERGKIEFLAHAERGGAGLVARLARAYATTPAESARECWLSADAVAARLTQRALLMDVAAAEQLLSEEASAA